MYRTNRSNERPLDNVDYDSESRAYERFGNDYELPPTTERPADVFLTGKFVLLYAVFFLSFLALILYRDAPYREQPRQEAQQNSSSGIHSIRRESPVHTRRISGKVSKVASNNDDYPRLSQHRNVTSNLFPYRYLMMSGSRVRYYLPRWLMFLLPDDELKNARNIEIEHDGQLFVGYGSMGARFHSYSVTTLKVDGTVYLSPMISYGVTGFFVAGLLSFLGVMFWKLYKR